jgi:hypothetical protein
MYLLCLALLSEGYLCHVYMDPKRPVWAPLWNMAFNQGGPVPDYIYKWSEVEPEGVYRISGYRGTCRFVEVSEWVRRIMATSVAETKPAPGQYDLDDLTIGEDGYFSVIMSAKRPEGYDGDWWELHAETGALMMRSCSTDWRHEIDPRVAIERLDPVAPSTPEEIAERFAELPAWIEGMVCMMTDLARWYHNNFPINGLKVSPMGAATGGLTNQFYYDGSYVLEDDEALIIETELPRECRYWQMLVADDRFCTVDWFNRQSSFNDKTARIDTDGKLRAVISKQDPGVINWLDKADNAWGIIQMRFNKASDSPVPTAIKCKVADVRRHLPADTPVIDAEQRRKLLAERREGAQLRRFW